MSRVFLIDDDSLGGAGAGAGAGAGDDEVERRSCVYLSSGVDICGGSGGDEGVGSAGTGS